jgi:hypothetical protein
MRPVVRAVLVGAGVLAACLLALWASLMAGTWLAINATAGTVPLGRIAGALVGVGALALLGGAVLLLADDLRQAGRRR